MSEHPASAQPHHETRDISLRAAVMGGVVIGIVVGGLVILADVLFPQKSLDRLLRRKLPATDALLNTSVLFQL